VRTEAAWLVLGFAGQALFTMRFLVQWVQSERRRESVIPTAFWYFSIAGGLTLLVYAIYRWDPVFMLGQAGGLMVYVRNLHFIRIRQNADAAPPGSSNARPVA
jgi:lipid-A-disaccharide synthase-like uncharacterized protein